MRTDLLEVAAPASATQNTCKMCAPLGASLAFRGIEGGIALIHGSQGCATYIRRHLISHFREPVDIASSSFTEQTAVFGGQQNLFRALDNVTRQYAPQMIGIASSCLSETLGEDVRGMLARYRRDHPEAPWIVMASTPSYSGTHATGFHTATRAIVETIAIEESEVRGDLALFPGFVSCTDMRHLKSIMADFGLAGVMLPDYSDTLDAPVAATYEPIPSGGTLIAAIRGLGSVKLSLTLGRENASQQSAACFLEERFGVPRKELGLPIGIEATDAFFAALEESAGRATPERHVQTRGRLIDSYVDAHKYLFGAKVAVYGEENLVTALARFIAETGARPVLCATGGRSPSFLDQLKSCLPDPIANETVILENADFARIEQQVRELKPDVLIGDSHGYATSRGLNIPLVRVGFPIHDRIGAQRTLHVGYEGTQLLFDRIVNALLQAKQDASPVGYQHM